MEFLFADNVTDDQAIAFVDALESNLTIEAESDQTLIVTEVRPLIVDGNIVPKMVEAHVLTDEEFEAGTPDAGHWYSFLFDRE